MSLEGRLSIAIDRSRPDRAIRIRSTRPFAAAKVLLGKSPEQALAVVPLLFNICANAQAYAAFQAVREAAGGPHDADADAARQILVGLETLREHCLRILLDWPGFAGRTADKSRLPHLLAFDRQFKGVLFKHEQPWRLESRVRIRYDSLENLLGRLEKTVDWLVFGGGLEAWRHLENEAQLLNRLKFDRSLPAAVLNEIYRRGWTSSGRNEVKCLPELEAGDWRDSFAADADFIRQPHWRGECFETGSLARQARRPLIEALTARYGNGLAARIAARLLEVADLPERLRRLLTEPLVPGAAAAGADGSGLAQVQAARGLLIHAVKLGGGGVENYRIVAPTEWNFHPRGVVAEGLKSMAHDKKPDLAEQARLWINAVDPCVQCDVEWLDGGLSHA